MIPEVLREPSYTFEGQVPVARCAQAGNLAIINLLVGTATRIRKLCHVSR